MLCLTDLLITEHFAGLSLTGADYLHGSWTSP